MRSLIDRIGDYMGRTTIKGLEKVGDHTTRFCRDLETDELQETHTQIAKLQRKQMGNNSKIALARFRIANLEQIIEDI
ncbi:hypothetical protein Tco_0216229 [Tanacetum coccineum]